MQSNNQFHPLDHKKRSRSEILSREVAEHMNMFFPSLAHDGNETSIFDFSNYHDSNNILHPLKKRARSAPVNHGNSFADENIEMPFASIDRNGYSTNNPFDVLRGSQLLSQVYASSSGNEPNFATPSAASLLLGLDLPPASFEPLSYMETPPLDAAPVTNTRSNQVPLNSLDICHDIYQSLPLQERFSQETHGQLGLMQPNSLAALYSQATAQAAAQSSVPSESQPEGSTSHSISTNISAKNKNGTKRFKPFHEEKWNVHLEQLRDFKKTHGHCLVPHTFPENQHLARWVKRQRRQYKLMLAGQISSTMTQERVNILNTEGFIWDSHDIIWRERFNQLLEYKNLHGHTRVPSYCKENPRLASWVKCQRRQHKLFWEGKRSSMSAERTQLLNDVGFTWEVKNKKAGDEYDKLVQVLGDLK
jgi:hypothetical protein